MYIFLFQVVIPPDQLLPIDTTAYHFFAANGLLKEITVCVKQGFDLSVKTPSHIKERPQATALHLAAQGGHAQICDLLLETNQLTVDDVDFHLMTPLHYAAMHG